MQLPTSPSPQTREQIAGGKLFLRKTSSIIFTIAIDVSGVEGAGFQMTEFPQAYNFTIGTNKYKIFDKICILINRIKSHHRYRSIPSEYG